MVLGVGRHQTGLMLIVACNRHLAKGVTEKKSRQAAPPLAMMKDLARGQCIEKAHFIDQGSIQF